MTTGWGRIPLFNIGELDSLNGYVITAIYIDTETDEFVVEYYIAE